jgi:hypothetical protein
MSLRVTIKRLISKENPSKNEISDFFSKMKNGINIFKKKKSKQLLVFEGHSKAIM